MNCALWCRPSSQHLTPLTQWVAEGWYFRQSISPRYAGGVFLRVIRILQNCWKTFVDRRHPTYKPGCLITHIFILSFTFWSYLYQAVKSVISVSRSLSGITWQHMTKVEHLSWKRPFPLPPHPPSPPTTHHTSQACTSRLCNSVHQGPYQRTHTHINIAPQTSSKGRSPNFKMNINLLRVSKLKPGAQQLIMGR